jgi:plasmid stabilization system protein ParE
LAVRDYAHSTAPNRRFPDLVAQRLLKAAFTGQQSPYTNDELATLARHCTDQEDNAAKVERQVRKSAAALLLASRIGAQFDAIVTGASQPRLVFLRWCRIITSYTARETVVVGRNRLARAHVNHFGVASETGYTTSSSDAYHFVPLRGNQARIR